MSPTCKDIFKPSHSSKQLCRPSPRFPSPAASAPYALSFLLPSGRTRPPRLPGHHPLLWCKPGAGRLGEGRQGRRRILRPTVKREVESRGIETSLGCADRRGGEQGVPTGDGAAPYGHRVGQPGLWLCSSVTFGRRKGRKLLPMYFWLFPLTDLLVSSPSPLEAGGSRKGC